MNRKVVFAAWAALCLAGLKTPAGGAKPGQEDQTLEQEDRPIFFASRVLYQQDVVDPDAVLGEPDDDFAEILPGGQMIFLMEDRIYPSMASDDGLILCEGDIDYGLAGWFPVGDSQNPQQYAWLALLNGKSPSGFRLAAFRPDSGSPGVNMLKIVNNDTKSLWLDAVVGYGHEPEDRGPLIPSGWPRPDRKAPPAKPGS
jgi:hypothetical protein